MAPPVRAKQRPSRRSVVVCRDRIPGGCGWWGQRDAGCSVLAAPGEKTQEVGEKQLKRDLRLLLF